MESGRLIRLIWLCIWERFARVGAVSIRDASLAAPGPPSAVVAAAAASPLEPLSHLIMPARTFEAPGSRVVGRDARASSQQSSCTPSACLIHARPLTSPLPPPLGPPSPFTITIAVAPPLPVVVSGSNTAIARSSQKELSVRITANGCACSIGRLHSSTSTERA